MKSKSMIVDWNAHITNIQVAIRKQTRSVRVTFSFQNLNYGTVKALQLRIWGYDSFGELVKNNDKNYFTVTLQDINILPGEVSTELSFDLPNSKIDTVKIEEKQVCYTNGSVIEYTEKQEQEYSIQIFGGSSNDKKIMNYLKERYKYAQCYALTSGDEWICSCGQMNKNTMHNCLKCGGNRETILMRDNEQAVAAALEDRHEREEEKKKMERKKRIGGILLCAFVICAGAGIGTVAYKMQMNERMTFADVDEMDAYVRGTWISEDDKEIHIIRGHLDEDEMLTNYQILYYKNRGYFTANDKKYIINRDETITCDGQTYVKQFGNMSRTILK